MAKIQKEQVIKSETIEENYIFEKHKRHGYLFPLILIFIGVVFLLNNLGILPWDVWNNIWIFWPLLLVIWGLQMIFGKSDASRIIVSLITLFVLAGILTYILFIYGILGFIPVL